ncbi:hypothetical protein AAFF_G00294060 [Aldrovandia affinis]|uniref:Uncharacterized protein n=1 Tax=Aldrovandia affinis TaxID=143900 RepID=A0AAD7RBN2_9TELE|nr:hypothetical protein AAFF_G00294060 [Aldrovandia affinis]
MALIARPCEDRAGPPTDSALHKRLATSSEARISATPHSGGTRSTHVTASTAQHLSTTDDRHETCFQRREESPVQPESILRNYTFIQLDSYQTSSVQLHWVLVATPSARQRHTVREALRAGVTTLAIRTKVAKVTTVSMVTIISRTALLSS